MEENLRNIDDHLNLYTLEPPKPPGSPFPAVAHEGDGQIYSDGTYAVLNAGSWVRYPARKGVLVMLQDGTEAWQSTGAQWQKASALDTAPVIAAAEAAIRPLAEAAAIDASRAENAAAVDAPTRAALEQLIAGSIQIEADNNFRQLTLAEVQQMPIVTVAEAALLLLEVNTDFFIQALPRLLERRNQLMQSIGSALRSS